MRIPLTVHSLWLPPDGYRSTLPREASENIRLWSVLNPGLEVRTWTEADLPELYRAYDELELEARVAKCRFPAMQSDLLRLAILHRCGGVWTDLKNRPIAPIRDWIEDELNPVLCEHWPTPSRPNPSAYVCNSWMASPAGSALVFDVLAEACTGVKQGLTRGGVFGVTGGALIMKLIKRAQANRTPYAYTLLPHDVVWGARMLRTVGSYNAPGQHWSERQKHESLYLNDVRARLPA